MMKRDSLTPSWLPEFLGLASVNRLVDVGCGGGVFTAYLRERAAKDAISIGIDLDEKALRKAPRLVGTVWVRGEASRLPVRSNWADLVLCRRLLLNVSGPLATIQEMARIARVGGSVAAIEPDFLKDGTRSTVPGEAHFLRQLLIATSTATDLGIGPKAPKLFRKVGLREVSKKVYAISSGEAAGSLPTVHQEIPSDETSDLVRAWRSEILRSEGEAGFRAMLHAATRLDRLRKRQLAEGKYRSAASFRLWVVTGLKKVV